MVQGGREGEGGAKENRRMNGKTGFEKWIVYRSTIFCGKSINRFGSSYHGKKADLHFFTIFSHFPYFN